MGKTVKKVSADLHKSVSWFEGMPSLLTLPCLQPELENINEARQRPKCLSDEGRRGKRWFVLGDYANRIKGHFRPTRFFTSQMWVTTIPRVSAANETDRCWNGRLDRTNTASSFLTRSPLTRFICSCRLAGSGLNTNHLSTSWLDSAPVQAPSGDLALWAVIKRGLPIPGVVIWVGSRVPARSHSVLKHEAGQQIDQVLLYGFMVQ